mgnify:FL=1|tara:strand:- start:75372 stop:76316 length:945 start_codon:yes stop_codon:yes gene_type:complete
MSTVSKITTSILFMTMLTAGACSSDKRAEPAEETPTAFPESATKLDSENLTAQLPVSPEPSAIMEHEEGPTPAVVPEPERFSEWMARARMRFQSQELAGALADYRAAVALRPSSQHAQIQLARTLLATGQGTEAREHAEAAIELDGTSSLAWNTMGRVELAEGENDAAIASFERSTEEDADNSYAWNNLGFVLIEEELFEEAVSALEEATTGGSPQSYMWNNLGMAYEHLDQIELARAAYRQAGNAGSAKALANFERLEGVVSLIASGGEELAPDPVGDALELEAAEEAPEFAATTEEVELGAETVEVAEVHEP